MELLIERARYLTKYSEFYFIEKNHIIDEFYGLEHKTDMITKSVIFGISSHTIAIDYHNDDVMQMKYMYEIFNYNFHAKLQLFIEIFELYLSRNDFVRRGVSRQFSDIKQNSNIIGFSCRRLVLLIYADGSLHYKLNDVGYNPFSMIDYNNTIYDTLRDLIRIHAEFNEMFDFTIGAKPAIKNE